MPLLLPMARATSQTTSPITAAARASATRLAEDLAHRESRHLVAHDLQGPSGGHEVGERERQPEAEDSVAIDEDDREHDVDHVLDDVDDERRACVVVGVEAAQDEQVHREPDQPEREAAERPRCRERVVGAVLAVLEEGADDRAAEHEDADAGRDRQQGDQPHAERRAGG